MRKEIVKSKVEQLLKKHLKIQTDSSRVQGLVEELLALCGDEYEFVFTGRTLGEFLKPQILDQEA